MSTALQENQGTDYDPQEHLGCYIFTPPNASSEAQRPLKRRRTSTSKGVKQKGKATAAITTDNSLYEDVPEGELLFPQLFGGKESSVAAKRRWESYNELWEEQEKRTNEILASVNEKMLEEVSEFVKRAIPESYDGKVPTAVILVGPNIASHGLLFNQLATRIQVNERIGPAVVLSSKDATNLKGVLKKLIKDATQEDQGLDDEDTVVTKKTQGAKLLNYDLQILQNWCQKPAHEGLKVTIAIQDTEAFDSNILSDLVSLMSAYLNRIPFTLLLGVATSIEIFHEKVPKSIIRLMRGEKFDVERAEECLARIFDDATIGAKSMLRLGPSLSDFLFRRQKNHTQSIQAFVAALKYAYMSHFYANPLSIFLAFVDDLDGLDEALKPEYLEAVRNLPSFRRRVESLLEEKNTKSVRLLLDDDAHLHDVIKASISLCRNYTKCLAQALEVLEIARSFMVNQNNKLPRHELYPKALLGELNGSPVIRELLLAMKKMNSTKLVALIDKVIAIITDETDRSLQKALVPLRERIAALIKESQKKNLNSEFDLSVSDTLRATVVSKRVQLSEKKSTLTKEEEEYSKCVKEVHDIIEKYFSENMKGLEGLLLHEVFFYDLLSPHRDVFAPRSRYAIERALSRPQDYLGCACCSDSSEYGNNSSDNPIMPTMPVASILYKLYLESGPLINTFDLWSAFYSIVGDGEGGDAGEGGVDRATGQVLFYRGLAELRALGFVRASKKKTDHLAKLAWKGL
ncbi:origin recognition complex subunit 3 N-terminus-domain-containing protein [Terfezia claveryi]|nr:origin recognition complex subunit 3 N-terminus-domain-containing protein [Terfezia claveryi]